MTIVYNNNPVAVCPDSEKVIAGFSREDLFTVVMDHFQTDTADYADILLPATTQLEHYDVHVLRPPLHGGQQPGDRTGGGVAAQLRRCSAALRRAWGSTRPCFRDSDEDLCRMALNGASWDSLKRAVAAPRGAAALRAVRAGRLPRTPSGKCEFYSEWLAKQGIDPLPFYNPPAKRGPLSPFVSLPACAQLSQLLLREHAALRPRARAAPGDAPRRCRRARHRGRRHGARIQRARQLQAARARQREAASRRCRRSLGVVEEALADRRNANNLTSQRTSDIGGGATFYDCRVQVDRA